MIFIFLKHNINTYVELIELQKEYSKSLLLFTLTCYGFIFTKRSSNFVIWSYEYYIQIP